MKREVKFIANHLSLDLLVWRDYVLTEEGMVVGDIPVNDEDTYIGVRFGLDYGIIRSVANAGDANLCEFGWLYYPCSKEEAEKYALAE